MSVHGQRFNDTIPRLFFTVAHTAVIAGVYMYQFGDTRYSAESSSLSPTRCYMLAGMSTVYWLRTVVAGFTLLPRPLGWAEALSVGPFLAVCHGSMVYSQTAADPLQSTTLIAIALYIIGSCFNTGSELQRKRFKANPQNKGKLYTKGLFALTMHPNYFGDILLFSGYALASGNIYTALVPLTMALGFVAQHIPDLDSYLAKRYPEQFPEYSRKTAKLIPGLY